MIIEAAPAFDTQYAREPGVHAFVTRDGTPVTAVAAHTWEDFATSMSELPPTSGYIISPELITAPWEIEGLAGRKQEIAERVNVVRQLSEQQPEALIMLGTPTVDDVGVTRNSLALIQDGESRGYVDKRGIMWLRHVRLFSREKRLQGDLLSPQHAALICSDMVTAPGESISPHTETLLASTTWAVPRPLGSTSRVSDEVRFKQTLEKTMAKLFTKYPGLQEVITVDKALPNSELKPYTAHFKRIDVTQPHETHV